MSHLDLLGYGLAGEVYAISDDLAIKNFLYEYEDFTNEEIDDMIRDEMKIQNVAFHLGVAPQAFEIKGHSLIMERIHGDTLGEKTNKMISDYHRGKISLDDMLSLIVDDIKEMMKLATILIQHSICHGDISPKNVMYSYSNGRYYIIDYGGVTQGEDECPSPSEILYNYVHVLIHDHFGRIKQDIIKRIIKDEFFKSFNHLLLKHQ